MKINVHATPEKKKPSVFPKSAKNAKDIKAEEVQKPDESELETGVSLDGANAVAPEQNSSDEQSKKKSTLSLSAKKRRRSAKKTLEPAVAETAEPEVEAGEVVLDDVYDRPEQSASVTASAVIQLVLIVLVFSAMGFVLGNPVASVLSSLGVFG